MYRVTQAIILTLMLTLSGVRTQEGRIHYVRADELRDYSGRCFDADQCSLRDTGESWTIHQTCERATCVLATNGTLLEKRSRCPDPPPLFTEECYIVRVQGRPFPDCCPQLYCNDELVSFSLPWYKSWSKNSTKMILRILYLLIFLILLIKNHSFKMSCSLKSTDLDVTRVHNVLLRIVDNKIVYFE